MAMSALAPTTSITSAATRPRTRRSNTTAGMVIVFSVIRLSPKHYEDRRQQRDGAEAAEEDTEERSITNRAQARIVRQCERSVADDRRERGHDDGLPRLRSRAGEVVRSLEESVQDVHGVVRAAAD